MDLTVAVSDLRDALVAARYATPANPSVVAYSGVLLVAEDSRLTVTGFDGEFAVEAVVSAEVRTPGRFLVQPRPLAAYLATLPDDAHATITTGDGDLQLAVIGAKPYRFRPVTATFPPPPVPASAPVEVDFNRFSAALGAVRAAVSKESPAVQVVSNASGLVLHATDNFRLARAHLPEAGFGEFTGLVPVHVLERAARFGVTAVRLDPAGRVITLHCGSITLTSRLMAIPFPSVEGVLAAAPPARVKLPAAEILKALAPLAAVTESSTEVSPLIVSLSGSTLTLSASSADTGYGTEELALPEAITAPFEFKVKLPYLREALSGLAANELTLAYSSALQPLFLLADKPVSTTLVVMPMRV